MGGGAVTGWASELSARWQREDEERSRSAVADVAAPAAVVDEELREVEDGLGIPRGSLTDPVVLVAAAAASPGMPRTGARTVTDRELRRMLPRLDGPAS
jgi:hypothetical protein